MLNILNPQGSNSAFIWRDLKWVDRIPHALIEQLDGGVPTGQLERVQLTPGCFIGLDTREASLTRAGLSSQRFCAGFAQALVDGVGFETVPCPERTLIEKGKQCARCLARDEFSAMHSIHRGASLNPAAESYANLEHWLYVATFPDGSSKVGTASAHSNPRRLDEQAVANATLVGHARDGRQVRIWEDLVSREAGIVQAKQVRAKYKAWTNPLPSTDLQVAHEKAVSLANWTLQEAALFEDFIEEDQIITEPWVPSASMEVAYRSLRSDSPMTLHAYDSLLDSACGFYVLGATGKFVVAHFGDQEQPFLLNLADLAGRAVLPFDYLTEQPTVQNSLF